MAAAIDEQLGMNAELIKGDGGIFDVAAGGELVFSKHREGRFPDNAEVLDALRERGAGTDPS